MQEGNISGALKVLTNNMSDPILPLTDKNLRYWNWNILTQMRHPTSNTTRTNAKVARYCVWLNWWGTDKRTAIRAKENSGPSGSDLDGWESVIVSSCFGTATPNLCKAIAELVNKLCIKSISNNSHCVKSVQIRTRKNFVFGHLIRKLVAYRLLFLQKNTGLKPMGSREVLKRVPGKAVMMINKKGVMKTGDYLQVCVAQEAGSEAAIQAGSNIFKVQNTEVVSLIDSQNAFNAINKKAMLHNISLICPIISTYVNNCYNTP